MLSPELRRVEARLADVAKELEGLPGLSEQPFASRYGFRSANLPGEDEPHWVRIDLGRVEEITRIVAVPVNIPAIGTRGAGYGFPRRFRIEVADNPEMEGAVTVVDRTAEDLPNPGRHPVDFRTEGVRGRFVRFTSTRHYPVEEGFIWALEELVVLSGNRWPSSAFAMAESSSSLELYPNWALQRINDGQSALAMPVTVRESPTRGYLSAVADSPSVRKWLAMDLGREFPINEIRLLPVVPDNFEHAGLMSFPRGYRLQLATDADFEDVTWESVQPKTNLVGYPGRCAVVLRVEGGNRGRYLRLETTELWGEGNKFGYALAEIQAYSGDDNVALGKAVTASDARKADGRWSPAAAVDGNGSRHELVEMPSYLDLIARRATLENEQDGLLERRAGKLRTVNLTLGYGFGVLGVAAVLGWGSLLLRQRIIKENAVARLRDQIARDLHDDIGSNLGGIVLLSEMGSLHSEEPQVRDDFAAIREAAEMTSQSMQDIVWLIQRENASLRDLLTRMRQSAQLILGDEVGSFAVRPPEFKDRKLSLLFRRHFFLAFKETLNNARKHARATEVEVRIEVENRGIGFSVRDDGIGFDPNAARTKGYGLANLRRRAERLDGSVLLESAPGEGTFVHFKAPTRQSSK